MAVATALILLVNIILPSVSDAQDADTEHATLLGSIIVFFILAILYFIVKTVKSGRKAS